MRGTGPTLFTIRLNWWTALIRQLDPPPTAAGTSNALGREEELAEWAPIEKAIPKLAFSFPSTLGISRAMPTDDLLDQFFAKSSGKRMRAQ